MVSCAVLQKILLGWWSMGKRPNPAYSYFHFGFEITGLLIEGLDSAPRPSVINVAVLFVP